MIASSASVAAWWARSSSSGPVIGSWAARRRSSPCAIRSNSPCSRTTAASRSPPLAPSARSRAAALGERRAEGWRGRGHHAHAGPAGKNHECADAKGHEEELGMTRPHPGGAFPALSLALPGGDRLELPDAVAGHFGVVLLYRGSCVPIATHNYGPSPSATCSARSSTTSPSTCSPRLRPGPRRPRHGQRVLQWRDRTAGPRRRHRPDPLPARVGEDLNIR